MKGSNRQKHSGDDSPSSDSSSRRGNNKRSKSKNSIDTISISKSERIQAANPIKLKLYNNVKRGLHFDERKVYQKLNQSNSNSQIIQNEGPTTPYGSGAKTPN